MWGAAIEEIRPGDVVLHPAGGEALARRGAHHGDDAHRDRGASQRQEQRPGWRRGATRSTAPCPRVRRRIGTAPAPGASTGARPSAAQRLMGDIAPKLAQLTDTVLFGDVWARPGLARRDRSLVTVSALIAMNRPDQLRSHLALARQNGVTQEEAIETITHLAFYAGWPSAVTAVGVAREVFAGAGR